MRNLMKSLAEFLDVEEVFNAFSVFIIIISVASMCLGIFFAVKEAKGASLPVISKNLPIVRSIEVSVAPPVEPLTAIEQDVLDICKHYPNVKPELVHSIIWYESRYNSSSVSKSGCVGLMQVSPKWHKQRAERLGVTNLHDQRGNILVGVDYLNDLYRYNGEDWELALMLYSMDNKKARQLHSLGMTTTYVDSVLSRSYELRKEAERRGEAERGIIRSGVNA